MCCLLLKSGENCHFSTLVCKIFWGSMPPDPVGRLALRASRWPMATTALETPSVQTQLRHLDCLLPRPVQQNFSQGHWMPCKMVMSMACQLRLWLTLFSCSLDID